VAVHLLPKLYVKYAVVKSSSLPCVEFLNG
jgi:hypothetical protein